MGNLLPYLIIQAPDGTEEKLDLKQDCYRFGRSPEPDEQGNRNDRILYDPEEVISRYHCLLKRELEGWVLQDTSTNKTHVYSGELKDPIEVHKSRIKLISGDIIRVQSWVMTFYNIGQGTVPLKSRLLYVISEETLYRCIGIVRIPVDPPQPKAKRLLRPMAIKMLQFMAHRNLEAQKPVCCTYEEFIEHLWQPDDQFERGPSGVTDLADEIRAVIKQALNSEKAGLEYLRTIRGKGYQLEIDCEP